MVNAIQGDYCYNRNGKSGGGAQVKWWCLSQVNEIKMGTQRRKQACDYQLYLKEKIQEMITSLTKSDYAR